MTSAARHAATQLTAILTMAACSPQQPPAAPKPFEVNSLLLVTLDTTRPDYLAPYGAPADRTPELQQLADQGTVFDAAYAVTPLTLPSHASLFTGLNPTEHGVRNNGTYRLADQFDTLAEILQRNGFRTAAFVAATVVDGRYGLAQGFDSFNDSTAGGAEWIDGIERRAESTVAAATEWLDRRTADEEYFAWVHLFDPHAEFDPPFPFDGRFADDPYAGEIAYMDYALGSLFRHPAVRDQLIVVIGDHGEGLLEHGEANHGMLLYDATLRIPLIVRHPSLAAGRRVATPVSQIDILPTLLDLLEIEGPAANLHGASLATVFDHPATLPAADRPLYAETWMPYESYRWAKLHAVRRGNWKYIHGPDPELYDLDHDARELTNRVDDEPATTRRLAASLAGLVDAEPTPDASLEQTQAEIDKLRSLGYLGGPVATVGGPLSDPKAMIDIHRRIGEAQQKIEAGDLVAADEQLARVYADDPTNVTALNERARIAWQQNRLSDAQRQIEAALELAPDDGHLRRRAGSILLAAGEFAAAREQLTAAVELLDPVPAAAHLHLAQAASMTDDWPLAERHARLALDANTDLPGAWIMLAAALEEQDRIDDALNIYRRLLSESPGFAAGHFNLALLLKRQGHFDAAARELALVLELQPQHAKTHYELALLYGGPLADRAKAEYHYRECAAADPDHPGLDALRRALDLD